MIKKLLYGLATIFTFVTSTSAISINLNSHVSNESKITLTAVEGTTTSEFEAYGPDKLVDNNFDNSHKWYTRPGNDAYAIFSSSNPVKVSRFVVYNAADTGSDLNDRRWSTWSIYASPTKLNRNDSNWVNIYTSDSGMPTSSCTSRDSATTSNSKECVSSDTTNLYKYFKVECSSYTTFDMQMGELDLYGTNAKSITYMDGDNEITGLKPIGYIEGVGVATLPNAPSKAGQSFVGWYDAKTGGNKITNISTTETGDKTLYARYISSPTGTALGGYYMSGSSKKQIVMFGYTIPSDYLSSVTEYGIKIYDNESCSGTPITKSSVDVASLISKSGRFYTILGDDETIVNDQTYFAKAYAISGGTTIYSSLLSAAGNYNTEYKL